MLKEFREFAMRGNVMDMAVGIIIGAAFGKIVTSFVNDILMPPIGLLLGNLDFTNMFITMSGPAAATLDAAKKAGAVTLNYGLFVSAVIDFVIVAFVIFMLIKQMNRLRRPAPVVAAAPATRECPYCISAIPLKATRCPQCTAEVRPAA